MVWPVWVVQAVLFVATTIISIALAPKPRNAKAASLDDFKVPTAEEGRSIPVVFGTVMVTGPNVVWYGDLDKQAIRKSSFGQSQVVGFKYYLGLHYVISFGPIDEFLRWDWDEKIAWEGSLTASGTQSINKKKLFGGGKGEGGLIGDFDLMMGDDTQTPNAYLLAQIGAPLSAYRSVVSVVWKGGYVGKSQYLKPVQFLVRRTAAGWEQGTAWNSADVTVDGGMNPAHLVYEVLTSSVFGYGEPTAAIDETSFGAAADLFVTENFGLNIQWVQQTEIEDFLGEVCSHAGMVLGEDPTTGKYTLTPLRGDYVTADLDLIDEDSVIELIRYSRQGWGETVNEITLVYTDPVSYKPTAVTVHDLGNIRAQGRVISQTIKYPGIRNHDVAKTVAARELVQRSTPLGRGTVRCSRRAWRHQQGDVVRFSWEKEGFVDVAHRVMAIRKGTLEDGSIEIDLAEDVFGISTSTYVAASGIDDVPAQPPEPTDGDTAGATVISTTTTAPPGTPADGDSYYVPTGATGDWTGHAGEIATWDAEEADWVFETIIGTPIVSVVDDAEFQVLNGAGGTNPVPWVSSTMTGPNLVLGRKTAGPGPVEELTLSEVLDFIGSAAWGDVLYRGETGWARLPAGTAGRFLMTNGADANPQWAGVLAGGGGLFSAVQSTDLVITSNAAFQDTECAIALNPGTYAFESFYESIVNATPGMTVRIEFTGTETQFAAIRSFARGTTVGTEQTAAQPYDVSYAVTATGVTTTTGVIVVSVAGTLKMRAKQNTSSGTSVTFSKGSWLRVSQIG